MAVHSRRALTQLKAEPTTPSEEFIDLQRSITELPTGQRLAIDCFYFVGLSVAEVAIVMGCSEGTVKAALAAARKSLRAKMER